MTYTVKDLRPVRRGAIYCAPFCGGNCTMASYWTAVTSSNKLAKKLGRGWEPRVWENLGWHWSVARGPLEIHPSGNAFLAFLSHGVGSRYTERATTAEGAVKKLLETTRKYMREIAHLVALIESR